MTYYDSPTKSAQPNVYECMKWCAANNKAQFWVFAVYYPGGPPTGGTTPWCQCSTSTSYPRVICGPNTAYNYNLERLTTVSWAVKRDEAKKDVLAQRKSLGLCPYPLDACVITPGSDGYECIDTQRELESCGGCRFGAISPANATDVAASVRGTDCTALPGVLRGAVSCVDGQCRVYACRSGWNLINGACVRA